MDASAAVPELRRDALGVPEVAGHEERVRFGCERRGDGAFGRAVHLFPAGGAQLPGPREAVTRQRRAGVRTLRPAEADRSSKVG